MINFNQFLAEGRDAPIFHGTHSSNLGDMIKNGITPLTSHTELPKREFINPVDPSKLGSIRGFNANKLKTTHYNVRYAHGVSFSRSKAFSEFYVGGRFSCVLEMDQGKLSQRYSIIPINYHYPANGDDARPKNTESEEFVVTDKPIPLKPYLKAIHLKTFPVNMGTERLNYEELRQFIAEKIGPDIKVIWNQ